MATIKGRAVVWSVGALTYANGIVLGAGGDAFPQAVGVTRSSEKAEAKDNQGIIRTQVFSGFKKMLTLTVIPAAGSGGNTIANARTAADTLMPQPGALVIITDDSGTIIDASYNLLSAKQNRTVDGIATIELDLETGDEGVDITNLVN